VAMQTPFGARPKENYKEVVARYRSNGRSHESIGNNRT